MVETFVSMSYRFPLKSLKKKKKNYICALSHNFYLTLTPTQSAPSPLWDIFQFFQQEVSSELPEDCQKKKMKFTFFLLYASATEGWRHDVFRLSIHLSEVLIYIIFKNNWLTGSRIWMNHRIKQIDPNRIKVTARSNVWNCFSSIASFMFEIYFKGICGIHISNKED